MAAEKRKLKNLLIYPSFQLQLIGIHTGLTALCLLIVWVSGNEAFRSLDPAAALSGTDVDVFRRILGHHSRAFNVNFLGAATVTMLLSMLASLYVSHKLAGPMVTLRRYFQALRDGAEPIPTLEFRDRDFLRDLPPLINEAVAAFDARKRAKAPPRQSAA